MTLHGALTTVTSLPLLKKQETSRPELGFWLLMLQTSCSPVAAASVGEHRLCCAHSCPCSAPGPPWPRVCRSCPYYVALLASREPCPAAGPPGGRGPCLNSNKGDTPSNTVLRPHGLCVCCPRPGVSPRPPGASWPHSNTTAQPSPASSASLLPSRGRRASRRAAKAQKAGAAAGHRGLCFLHIGASPGPRPCCQSSTSWAEPQPAHTLGPSWPSPAHLFPSRWVTALLSTLCA